MSASCAPTTSSAFTPGMSWTSMYVGIAVSCVVPRGVGRWPYGTPIAAHGLAAALLAVALFLPGIGVVVVAVALPEAELVVVEELEAADPFGALPEVALRNQQAERVAMLGLERLAP